MSNEKTPSETNARNEDGSVSTDSETRLFTTGELAKLCDVSVRTVQFYDEKGLLPPAQLSEGGRRLYRSDDLRKLRLICLLKALGLSLDAIRGVLESPDSTDVLLCLLEEQARRMDEELAETQRARAEIVSMMEDIRQSKTIPAASIDDMERIMKGKQKLKKDQRIMLVVGIICDIIEIGTIVWWIIRGDWLPFAIGMPVAVVMAILLVRMYYRDTAYICPHCHAVFKPSMKEFFWSNHTPRTRKLTCSVCKSRDWCVETTADTLGENADSRKCR